MQDSNVDSQKVEITYEPTDWLYQYLRWISQYPLLSQEETMALALRVQSGDNEAMTTLVNANLRLAYKIAKEFFDVKCRLLPLEDLLQEANIGLQYAVQHFQPENGETFSHYAGPCIVGFMKRAIAQKTSFMHVSERMYQTYIKMSQLRTKIYSETGSEPTLEQLSRIYSISSLDVPIVEDDDTADTLLDNFSTSDENEFYAPFAHEMTDYIRELVDECELNEHEKAVLFAYFGLGDEPPKSLRKLSKDLPFSFQRAQKILKKALKKLRNTTFQGMKFTDFIA